MPDDASDEELVAAARGGDERALDALLLRYRGVAHRKARSYFLVGAGPDDVVQEGMIGLYKAVREYDAGARASFRTFAELCIARQIVTAVRSATRRKHRPLNDYVSIHRPVLVDDGDERTIGDVLPSPALTDPAEQVICAERIRDLRQLFDTALSDLEAEVLQLHVDGRSYLEIARMLERHTKSIDNALQRIKRKLDLHLTERDAEIA